MTRRLDDFAPQHPAWRLLLGSTPFQVSIADPRFSFTTYVPRTYREITDPLPVLVAVHGTGRRVERMRDELADFAELHGVVVLAPLFPVGIGGPDDVDNYKGILFEGIRYDELLLSMLAQAAKRWRLDTDRVLLAGFSGGGQFAHRFTYLHPERVRAVSIGAPGRVTLPDDAPWPHGLGGVVEIFGSSVDLSRIETVPTQVVVGADDHASEMLAAMAQDPREAWAGTTRVERAERLASGLSACGAPVELTIVPGAGHDFRAVSGAVTDFFHRVLADADGIRSDSSPTPTSDHSEGERP